MASTLLAKTVCPATDQLGHRKGLTRLWALGPGVVMALRADLALAGCIGVERNPEQVSDV
jgi:hypothetical protein